MNGVRFQWLTPLAIELSPFGTKDNTRVVAGIAGVLRWEIWKFETFCGQGFAGW